MKEFCPADNQPKKSSFSTMETSSFFSKGDQRGSLGDHVCFLAQKQQKTEGIKKPESLEISRDSGLEPVVRIELTTCSLRKPDRAVFTCVHMCPQAAVRKGFRAFWPFHGFTQICAKITRRWQQESLLGVCSAWRFFRGMSK